MPPHPHPLSVRQATLPGASDNHDEYAALLPAALTRRRAMQLMAASLALSGTGCARPPDERIYPYAHVPEAAGMGRGPAYYASAFIRDGFAHGVLVGTKEGRPIKIEGNPQHPSSLGATDAFAQGSVLQLWDPDRAGVVRQRLAGSNEAAAASTWAAFETAWRARAPALAAGGGARLRVLSGPFTSPTLKAQRERLRKRYPALRWHVHAPLHDAHADAAARLAFGQPLQLVHHLDRADFVLALASDPFSEGPGNVRHAMDWARRRRDALAQGAALPELAAVEVAPGLFGARCDARLALPPAEIEALLWRVANRLFDDIPAPAAAAPSERQAALEARWARQLRQHGAAALLVAGAPLSAASQALVLLLSQRLGAFGHAVDAVAPLTAALDGDEGAETLATLTEAMRAGDVDTLLILDANPVYSAPADVPFAKALAQVDFTAHLGLYHDETALRCQWQLPQSHVYEQWSDALAMDGSATLVQPAIAPLYDTRSAHELLALLAGDDVRSGHDLVQRHWRSVRGEGAFDEFWRASLRAGTVEDSAAAPLALPPARTPKPPASFAARDDIDDRALASMFVGSASAHAGRYERIAWAHDVPAAAQDDAKDRALAVVFMADAAVHDGRYANIGWLQELPRPFSKLTWDNAIRIGRATAARLGLQSGDMVRASRGHWQVEAPVWVMGRHAEGVASLPLGYGRWAAGRVGNGVGFNAGALRHSDGALGAIALHSTGARHAFAVTQQRMVQDGRELARSIFRGQRVAPDAGPPSLHKAPNLPVGRHAWAMVIDLDSCIGCNACTIACQAENNIPVVGAEEVRRSREMHWIRVDRYDEPSGSAIFQPVPCMHCEKAPCELVCPVGATVHDSEGLNVQVYNRCVGTRFCSNNCPYKVRRFNFLQYADQDSEQLALQRNPDVTVRQRGVMEKCTYCVQRLSHARLESGKSGQPITDGSVLTACQAACPTRAIHFGDLNDAAADVTQARASPRHYAMLGELNTRPRTTYLARVVANEPRDESGNGGANG